jgi:dihydroorotase/N-acyl-D-amino-acid deacylase
MRAAVGLVLLGFLGNAQESYDLILTDGKIIDGTGNSWFYGDVAVRSNRIAKIAAPGVLDEAVAKERLDVRGLVIAPGFVDIQGGLGGRSVSKITQGVTTEISGEGWTGAPANDLTRAADAALGRGSLPAKFDAPHGFDAMLTNHRSEGLGRQFRIICWSNYCPRVR